jgi:hypothetical protein
VGSRACAQTGAHLRAIRCLRSRPPRGAARGSDRPARGLDALEPVDARRGGIVERKFFGGLTTAEVAEVMALSSATIEREWSFARAWLYRAQAGDADLSRRDRPCWREDGAAYGAFRQPSEQEPRQSLYRLAGDVEAALRTGRALT